MPLLARLTAGPARETLSASGLFLLDDGEPVSSGLRRALLFKGVLFDVVPARSIASAVGEAI